MKFFVLEDDDRRIDVMRRCLTHRFPQYESRFIRSAPQIIAALKSELTDTILISLDHDLEPMDSTAPGTGRDVADFLATQSPACPVVIHSTNIPAAEGMQTLLDENNWSTDRILPYEDTRWIEEACFPSSAMP